MTEKMHFMEYDPKQIPLSQERRDKDIDAADSVRVVDTVVDGLKISVFDELHSEFEKSPYYPKMMMKAIIYDYMNNLYSCRKIASALKKNIHFICFASYKQLDHNTTNRFRERMKRKIKHCIMLLCCLGLASCEPDDRFYNVFHYEPESPNEYPIYYDLNGELAEKGFQMENVVLCREQHDEGTDCYYAVFPEDNYVDLHDYGLEIRLPQFQCPGCGVINAAYNPLVSYGVIRELRYRHVNGGMEVGLRGNAMITAICFTDNDTLNRLWGNFVVRRVGDEKQRLLTPPWSDGNNEIWLNYPDGVLLSPDSTSLFSVMLPPGAFYRGFSMDVFCGDSLLYHVATEKDCTIRRNVVMKMPVIVIP